MTTPDELFNRWQQTQLDYMQSLKNLQTAVRAAADGEEFSALEDLVDDAYDAQELAHDEWVASLGDTAPEVEAETAPDDPEIEVLDGAGATPDIEIEVYTEPPVEGETEPETETNDAKPEIEATKPEVEPEVEPETKPEVEPEVKEAKPEVKAETDEKADDKETLEVEDTPEHHLELMQQRLIEELTH